MENEETFDKEAFIASQKARNNGSLENAVVVLGSENRELRNEKRSLKSKVESLETLSAQVPADDSLVLSKDEAKEWTKYQNFLKEKDTDFKALSEVINKFPELKKENKEIKDAEHYRKIAKRGIYVGDQRIELDAELLQEQISAKFPAATFDTKEKEIKGEKVKVTAINLPDKESAELGDFLDENLSKYLPSLKVSHITQEPKPIGFPQDPKPEGLGVDSESDKIAQTNQAKATHSYF